jgi:Bacterial PH domain
MTEAGSTDLVQHGFRLQPDEHLLMVLRPSGWWGTTGYYILTLGFYEFWRRATVFALTDQRILQRKGRIQMVEQNLPVVDVEDVTVTKILGVGGVRVSVAGGLPSASLQEMQPLPTAEARRFADAIMAQAKVARSRTAE